MAAEASLMEKLTALCKRRGFIYPGSEIYGGLAGFWDYGPLGVELKRHIKDLWWRDMVLNPPTGPDGKEVTMVGLDCAIIMNPKVWEASGHVAGFKDPMVSCKAEGCKGLFRADQLTIIRAAPQRPAAPDDGAAVCEEPRYSAALGLSPQEAQRRAQEFSRRLADKWSRRTGVPVDPRWEILDYTQVDDWSRIPCPNCGSESLTEPRQFNLMFESHAGALLDEASKVYLRPETAQGMFVNYRNVLDTTRIKLPFGIAQIGKAFRNEINPRNYTFRSREFEQMEIEFFCRGAQARGHAGRQDEPTDMDWYAFWRQVRYDWYVGLGLRSDKLRLRDQTEKELAHYSRACADIEYLFPFSDDFQELEGVAHRGCYDLAQHQQHSGRDMTYFDDQLWQQDAPRFKDDPEAARKAKEGPPYRFLPTVIEPSAGVDRAALAFLCEAYTEDQAPNDKGQMEKRVVMKLHPRLAPIKAAFFPLVNRQTMPDIAYALYRDAKAHWNVFYDDKGAIGRRYRRQDEAGTPFCITVDGQTLADGTVTIRDRDTLRQVRVGKDHVLAWLREHLA